MKKITPILPYTAALLVSPSNLIFNPRFRSLKLYIEQTNISKQKWHMHQSA